MAEHLRHGPLPEPIDMVDSLAFEWAAALVQHGAVYSLSEDDLWVRLLLIIVPVCNLVYTINIYLSILDIYSYFSLYDFLLILLDRFGFNSTGGT